VEGISHVLFVAISRKLPRKTNENRFEKPAKIVIQAKIILERFQSKASRMIVDAPLYVPNTAIRRDLQIPTVKGEIRRYSSQYRAGLSAHQNYLMELPDNRRLQRHLPNDLPTRFLV
jgi:hypothetical protein